MAKYYEFSPEELQDLNGGGGQGDHTVNFGVTNPKGIVGTYTRGWSC